MYINFILIQDANKAERCVWAQQHAGDTFDNIIWSDKASIDLKTHQKRKQGEHPKPKNLALSTPSGQVSVWKEPLTSASSQV